MDDSWKQERVSNRRRLSAIPMGASRLVAVQDNAGSAETQMANRRQSRRSISNPQSFVLPGSQSLSSAETGGLSVVQEGSQQSRPSSKGIFGNQVPADSSLTSMKEEEEGEEDGDWETERKKKQDLMMNDVEMASSNKPDTEVKKAAPPAKKVEPKKEAGILEGFSLPGVSFEMPSIDLPWNTPDVQDTSKHTAI